MKVPVQNDLGKVPQYLKKLKLTIHKDMEPKVMKFPQSEKS
jgi:hypothetical protein